MRRFLYDTAIFIYAVGSDHPYRTPCRELIELQGDGALAGEVGVELLQELAHVRARRTNDRGSSVRLVSHVSSLCVVHDLTSTDMQMALNLFEAHPELDMRDAIHGATALNRGIGAIVSPDRAFDVIEELDRIDPLGAPAALQ